MKKVLLALLVVSASIGYAQENVSVQSDSPVLSDPLMNVKPTPRLKKFMESQKLNKTSGGVITNAQVGWSEAIFDLYGGTTLFSGYQTPIYMDSTVKAEFSNATRFIGEHGIGTTYDPTSPLWGSEQFAETDDYTIDSVYIQGFYRTPTSIPNPSGDSLIVEFVWGMPSSTAFDGATFSANNVDTACTVLTPAINVTAGQDYTLTGTNKIRAGIELTAADITPTGFISIFGVEINQLIPAGNIVGFSFYFKSAYSSQVSTGDTIFSTVSPDDVKIPNFAGSLYQETNIPTDPANRFRYFCDHNGNNSTSLVYSETLYQMFSGGSAFLNNMMYPQAINGVRTFLMVSGTSTIGLDEEKVNNNVALYPNPTTGNVNIAISQGGTYNLEVVNMLGQVVHAEEVTVSGNEELRRDLSHLTKGIYLVNIKGDNYSNTSKLTINK